MHSGQEKTIIQEKNMALQESLCKKYFPLKFPVYDLKHF